MISTKTRPLLRPSTPPGPTVAQVYVGWVPNSPRTPWRQRRRHWRWDVTYFQCTSPHRDGVYDGRYHLGADVGYALTEWGAWRKVRRSMHRNRNVIA